MLLEKNLALTDEYGLPVQIVITPGNTHDIRSAVGLLVDFQPGQLVLRDKAYNANWLQDYSSELGDWANIPPKFLRNSPICFFAQFRTDTISSVQLA